MKLHAINRFLLAMTGLAYTSGAGAHTGGEHTGGLIQQLMHIVQSADHLFIVLALGVVVSLLIRHLGKKID